MTITPDDLRALADGLANQNSEAERIAARYAASADMLAALKTVESEAPHLPADIWSEVYAAIDKAERAEP